MERPSRRGFLAAVAVAPFARAFESGGKPLFDISLAQWSLHRTLRAGALDPLDFPKVARTTYGLGAVEYVSTFYREKALDRNHFVELKRRADEHGVKSLLIMVDGEGALGDPDESARTGAVANHHKWVEAAVVLGAHSIRVNAQSSGTREEQRDRAADGLRRLTEFGASRGIDVIVENHGGLSSDGSWLASVLAQVGHPRCGALPDFGNFRIAEGEWYDRYRGVAELMPFARAVSAKSNDFDEQGFEKTTDYRRMLRIVIDAGYRGWIGIEYEGEKLSEHEGILATKRLLERVRAEIEAERAKPLGSTR